MDKVVQNMTLTRSFKKGEDERDMEEWQGDLRMDPLSCIMLLLAQACLGTWGCIVTFPPRTRAWPGSQTACPDRPASCAYCNLSLSLQRRSTRSSIRTQLVTRMRWTCSGGLWWRLSRRTWKAGGRSGARTASCSDWVGWGLRFHSSR